MAPQKPTQDKWQQATRDALEKLDIRAEYSELGIDITGNEPNGSGWLECRAYGLEDISPSAGINVGHDHPQRGRYKSFVGDGENFSLFEFAAQCGRFPTWQDARNHYLEKAGVKIPGSKPPKSPADSLEFRDYNAGVVTSWCLKKPGIDEPAVKLCGGRLANESKRFTVVTLPVYGPYLLDDAPCGWVSWNVTGKPLEVFQGQGLAPKSVKMKSAPGGKSGWMGRHGLSILATAETVWITEGPGDMLALESRILAEAPDQVGLHAVVCNSGGAMERQEFESVAIFAGKRVVVVPDCDQAGQVGCRRRAEAIAEVASDVRFVRLPFEITANHGKDLRDFFNAGNRLADLGELAKTAEVIRSAAVPGSMQNDGDGEPAVPGAATTPENPVNPAEQTADHLMMLDLGIDVMGELGTRAVKVFSEFHRKIDIIPDVEKLKYCHLLQIAGPKIAAKVHQGQESAPGMYRMSEVREAISKLAGYRRVDGAVFGPGCWQGLDEKGQPTQSIVLVGAGEAAIRNGRPGLTKISRPRYGGRLIDISSSTAWYDFEKLNDLVLNCSQQFAGDTIGDLESLFSQWKWKDQGQAPKVLAGLIMATWIQTLWSWRPQVAINGQSNAGKSVLFKTLKGIFGRLCIASSDSTAAGIRQAINSSAAAVLLDELDSNQHRKEILEMLRSSGRGDTVLRGSANHKGQEFRMQHLVWTAGIESGLVREPDKNRFILQELQIPAPEDFGKLHAPPESDLAELGQRVLAVALQYAFQARDLAETLRVLKFKGINQRLVECYAVPAACYSVVMGESAGPAADVLSRMLGTLEVDEDMDDGRQLLSDILETEINMGRDGSDTVANLLRRWGNADCARILEAKGVGMVTHDGEKVLFVAHRIARRNLLKGTNWERQNIDQVLIRIPGSIKCKKRIGGKQPHGIVISPDCLTSLGMTSRDELEPENGTTDSAGTYFERVQLH